MRSFIPRILISIIAFALGSGSALLWNSRSTSLPAWNFPLTVKSDPPTAAPPPVTVARESEPPVSMVKRAVRFKCRNGVFSFLLGHLRKSEPDYDFDGFIKVVGISNCTELFEIEERVDLNNDGRIETIVRTKNNPVGNFFCGATGNCHHWIVRKGGRGYEIILDAPVTEEVNLRRGKTENYFDVVTRYHFGGMEHTLEYYAFRKGKYRIEKCVSEIVTNDGKVYFKRRKLSDCDG